VIKSKGWIKAINNHSSSIGSTFERELSIKENRIPYADYYGIEIKCTTKKDDFYISLFSAEPNSKSPNLIEDIAKKYGYPHKIEKKINVLNSRINYTSINNISFKYRANIYMDYKYNIIKILIENKFGQIVDERITWDINYIKEKVIDKCLYLAIIKSETKFFSGVQYVKYNEIKVESKSKTNKSELHYRDMHFGLFLYEYLNSQKDFTPKYESSYDFWRYISVCVIPDIVADRWDIDKSDHFYSKPTGIYPFQVYWYIKLSWQGTKDYQSMERA
jgi:hypothetical protein